MTKDKQLLHCRQDPASDLCDSKPMTILPFHNLGRPLTYKKNIKTHHHLSDSRDS